MTHTNYTLPEFVLLDGYSHEGNALPDRTVIQHIRSYTIMECVDMNEVLIADFTMPTHDFIYINQDAEIEPLKLVLHFSLTHEDPLPANDTLKEIFEKTAQWYCKYLAWEEIEMNK